VIYSDGINPAILLEPRSDNEKPLMMISTTVVSICLSSREQRQGATLFVVIVVGEPLMPPTPTGPGEDLTHSLLRGQDETPEQSPNLGHAQRDVRPR
jgi:hypothetical protein